MFFSIQHGLLGVHDLPGGFWSRGFGKQTLKLAPHAVLVVAVLALNAGNGCREFMQNGIAAAIFHGPVGEFTTEPVLLFPSFLLLNGLDGPVIGEGQSVVGIDHMAGGATRGAIIPRPVRRRTLQMTS